MLRLQLDEALQLLRGEGLLDPPGAVLLGQPGPVLRVVEVPAVEGVEHDLVLVAEGLAQGPHQLDVGQEPLRAVGRPVGEEPLLVAEALLLQLDAASGDGLGLDRAAEAAGVGLDALPGRPPQQAVHRHAEVLSSQVPQRVVHRADAHHVVAGPGVAVEPVHLVPDPGDGQRVLADQELPELVLHHASRLRVHQPVEAFLSAVRLDLRVEHPVLVGLDGDPRVVGVGTQRVLGVDVERGDLRLVGVRLGLTRAGDLPDLDVRDRQALRGGARGKGRGEGRGPHHTEGSHHVASSHVSLPGGVDGVRAAAAHSVPFSGPRSPGTAFGEGRPAPI